jgi:hypothetical protein
MMTRVTALFALLAGLAVGCSSNPPQISPPQDVNITVLLPNGQPASGLTLTCFPTGSGQMQGGGKLDAAGKVTAKLTPGKYTYMLEGPPAALKAAPAKYHQNDANNAFEVAAGTAQVEIKLTN